MVATGLTDTLTWGSSKEKRGALEALLIATAGRTEALEEWMDREPETSPIEYGIREGSPRPECVCRGAESCGVSPEAMRASRAHRKVSTPKSSERSGHGSDHLNWHAEHRLCH